MIRIFQIATILLLALLTGQYVHAAFWPGTEDIPLMEGITPVSSEDFSFDSPAGQIQTLKGETNLSEKNVYSFYNQALTSLGWIQKSETVYMRDGDKIQLNIRRHNEKTEVIFDLTLTGR